MPNVFDEAIAGENRNVFDGALEAEKPASKPWFNTAQLKEDWSPERMGELRDALSYSPLQHLPRAGDALKKLIPENSDPATRLINKANAGGLDFAQGTAEFATSPIGIMTAGLGGLGGPLARRGLSAIFAPLLTKSASEKLGEASVTKDPRTATEGALLALAAGAAGTHLARGEAVKPNELPKVEAEPAKPESAVKNVFDEALAQPEVPERKVEEVVEPAVERAVTPVEEAPESISVGPGAASPGDVPPAPRFAGVGDASVEPAAAKSLAPFEDVVGGLLGNAASKTHTFIKGVLGESMPKITAAAQPVGEAGVRYASSRIAAKPLASLFSSNVLEGSGIDPFKFGTALAEDNLRSVSQEARGRETAAIAEGKTEEAAKVAAEAERVKSLVGAEKSPFKTEDEYQDFLADPQVKEAIKRHIALWEGQVEPMYKMAMRIDPSMELPSRGQQTGARVNLKALFPDEEGQLTKPVGGSGSNLMNTFRKKSPFGVRAKGTGEVYEGHYDAIIANTFERQLEIANKNSFDNQLVSSGLAVIDKPGKSIRIGGKKTEAFPLARRVLVMPEKGSIPLAENIYVRSDLAGEYRRAANVDASHKIPILTPLMNQINRAALAGLTDFTVHLSNQATALFDRPISGSIMGDSFLSLFGRTDIPVTITKAIVKVFQDNRAQLAELAEIGAMREPHQGKKYSPGSILNKADQTTRLLLDDTYHRMVDEGLVENTETNRREYVNQIGQYNKRLQGPMKRMLRDTGFGPFVTAGTTFNALGARMATLSPGVKASSVPAAVMLRANVISKWVGGMMLIGAINYLLTKDKGGGLMGRPGVPIGKIDTGKSDENGRPYLIPAADILGIGRAMRVTGVGGAVNAKRFGLKSSDAVDASFRDIANSNMGPVAGPPVRFASTLLFGKAPAIGVKPTARPKAPGESQLAINALAALREANPVVDTIADYKEGKPLPEVIANQIPRFTVTPGRPAEMMDDYPRIVERAQSAPFIDYVIGEARRMEPERRIEYLEKMLEKLENDEDKQHAIREFKRRRVL